MGEREQSNHVLYLIAKCFRRDLTHATTVTADLLRERPGIGTYSASSAGESVSLSE